MAIRQGSDKVREARASDIYPIALYMRDADIEELWAARRHQPYIALQLCFAMSPLRWTIELDGSPIAMFGVGSESLLSDIGSPWLLGTERIREVAVEFLRCCPFYVGHMRSRYSYLENWVDDRNKMSINWLKWCGFEMGEPEPYGPDQLPFRRFSMEGNA